MSRQEGLRLSKPSGASGNSAGGVLDSSIVTRPVTAFEPKGPATSRAGVKPPAESRDVARARARHRSQCTFTERCTLVEDHLSRAGQMSSRCQRHLETRKSSSRPEALVGPPVPPKSASSTKCCFARASRLTFLGTFHLSQWRSQYLCRSAAVRFASDKDGQGMKGRTK